MKGGAAHGEVGGTMLRVQVLQHTLLLPSAFPWIYGGYTPPAHPSGVPGGRKEAGIAATELCSFPVKRQGR